MVTNAMWYNPPEGDDATQEVGITLGPISITMSELYTSAMSSLVMFPPVLLITTLFIKAGEKKPKVKQGKGERYQGEQGRCNQAHHIISEGQDLGG